MHHLLPVRIIFVLVQILSKGDEVTKVSDSALGEGQGKRRSEGGVRGRETYTHAEGWISGGGVSVLHPSQAIKLRRQIAVARSHYRKRGLQEEVGTKGRRGRYLNLVGPRPDDKRQHANDDRVDEDCVPEAVSVSGPVGAYRAIAGVSVAGYLAARAGGRAEPLRNQTRRGKANRRSPDC